MAKPQTVRFAAGSPEASFSGVWRLVVNKNDVFLGASKASMSIFKVSLHQSGVWVLAATQQSGATFERGNRRAKRWSRPLDHVAGVTRGPSVFVPHTSLGIRPLLPDESNPEIIWYQAPVDHETVEFSLYFVKPGVPVNWNTNETELAQCLAANGPRVFLLASTRESPADFEEACEKMLRENVFRMDDPGGFLGGSFLWITESRDAYKVPVIVDLPVPMGPNRVSANQVVETSRSMSGGLTPLKARTVERSSGLGRSGEMASGEVSGVPGIWDELAAGTSGKDTPVGGVIYPD